MEMLYLILKGTPWWIYVIFASILMLGIKGLKPRVISLKRLFIIPCILTAWAIYTIVQHFHSFLDLQVWSLFLLLGSWVGKTLVLKFPTKADKKKKLLTIEGSPFTLVLALMVFTTKYIFGLLYLIHPEVMEKPLIFLLDLITSGFIIGLFFGKGLHYFRRYKRAPHTNLHASDMDPIPPKSS